MSTRYAVVDLETTGPKFNRGERIIQIGVVFVENDQIVDEFSTLIQPLIPIPPHITQLTGISGQDVFAAPLFEEVAETLWEKLQGCVFVAHNINFDYKFLSQAFQASGYPALEMPGIDTVELIRVFYPQAKSYHLGDFCQEYGITLEHAHSANSDARATADVLLMTKAKIQLLPFTLMKQLHPYLSFLIRETGTFVWRWYEERDDHHTLKGRVVGPFTFAKTVSPKHAVSEQAEDFAWDKEDPTIIRQNNGVRLRAEQVTLIQRLRTYFDSDQSVGFLSAYAGVGKSLASVYAAWQQHPTTPIIVALPTNALVDQLMTTTLPQLVALTGTPLATAQLIGQTHFLPLAGFQALLQFHQHNWGHLSKNGALITLGTLVWLFETQTGRLEELNHGLQQIEYWRRVWTLADQAPTKAFQDVDFYRQQWQRVQTAQIIVTNQAFLIQHWEELMAARPWDDRSTIIIDECHQWPQTIKQQLAPKVSLTAFQSLLQKTDHALQTIEEALMFEQPDQTVTTQPAFYEAGFALEHLFQAHRQLLDGLDEHYLALAKKKRAQAPFEQFLSTSAFHAVPWHVSLSELWVYGKNLHKALSALFATVNEYQAVRTERALRWHRLRQQWQQMLASLEDVLLVDESSYLAIQAKMKGENTAHYTLKRTVYQASPLLKKVCQSFPGKWLLMSQVLPVYRLFDQMTDRFGVADYWYTELTPPLTYGQGTKGYYLPDERSMDKRNFLEGGAWIGHSLQQIWHSQRPGRVQVFFQSRALLEQSEEWLEQQASPSLRLHVYAQHEGDYLPKLRQQFEQDSQGILLGLMSFGEGVHFSHTVDRYLLTRLPFQAPDQADELAMSAWLAKHHRQYFRDYALPNMLVTLMQWLGRIWRTDGQTNALIVLDQRLISSQYAAMIKKILPPGFSWHPLKQSDLSQRSLH